MHHLKMSFDEVFNKLHENPQPVLEEAIRLFIKISDNILNDPDNLTIRTLKKSNSIIRNNILKIKGGKDCLKLMGFQENNITFTMPLTVSIKIVQKFKSELETWQKSNFAPRLKKDAQNAPQSSSSRSSVENDIIERIELPPLIPMFINPFLKSIEVCAHDVLQYANKKLLERAKKLIPLNELEINAQERLRIIQSHIKKNKLPDPDLSIQDTLILELLKWFKEDFFDWVDSPSCSKCGGQTSFSHMSTDPNLLLYTNRVELHKCKSCQTLTAFPRYNDLNILLETRKGRCGEWANVFTLFCHAMGWDARLVIDQGDHVWTEVFSVTQKRWLHCDSCENICDTPLVYENGWRKQISYVIAYSPEEVQDVSWRYSSYHKQVLKRRNKCSETELLQALSKINSNLQKNLLASRKKYLTRRVAMELVEFLVERKPSDQDHQGRTSGAEIWRMARGETQVSEIDLHVWQVNSSDVINTIKLRYCPTLDKYKFTSGEKMLKEIDGWNKGAYNHDKIFRKEEKDWKMVYLARKEGEQEGSISWKFDLRNIKKSLSVVSLFFNYETFENGAVSVKICSENVCISLSPGEKTATFRNFTGAQELTITATLSGGKGDTAWQHAQLFRQSFNSDEFSFSMTLTFN